MYIQLEQDYNRNDNKGLYVTMYKSFDDEPDMALIRIENGFLVWYESQNGEYMADHDDTCRRIGSGDYMTKENIDLVCLWLSRQFPGAEIDRSELKSICA
jgi:hypothetical protein